jgi:D-alanyl-D-alanine carboxypeptidase
MKRVVFLLTAVLVAQTVSSQALDKSKLDSYFDALEQNNRFMGSVAVSQNGNIIYTRSVGFSDIEKGLRADENSKYRIGSISKTFTAVLVFKAVEMRKLSTTETLDRYFPSIKNSEKITIGHLLSHRSGIHNITSDKDYLTWNTGPKTQQEMVQIIAAAGSDFEPDSKAEYSNSNYILLTYILEKSFKKPYTDLLTKYITKPAGLQNTRLGAKINPLNNECNSYSITADWKIEPETDISIPMGAGGIISTPVDLVKFSNALFGGKLLKNESLELMKTVRDNYGMGLFKMPLFEKTGYGHTGGIDGFTSVFSHFSDGNISYALTSNGTNFNNNDISLAVLSAAYNKPYTIPEFNTIILSPEELDQYTGVYSSSGFPLKITVSRDKATLMAQATGQSAFPLEPTEKHKFKFDLAGLVMEFNPQENTMTLKQGGAQFVLTKEIKNY